MTWQDLSLDWRMTWANVLAIFCMMLGMKAVVLLWPGASAARSRRFLIWPVLAPCTLERAQPLSVAPAYFLRAGLGFGVLLLCYMVYGQLTRMFHWPGLVFSYLAVPVVLLMMESLMILPAALWLLSGRLLPPVHRQPWAARSVADFWGHRWNLWVGDWFREVLFQRLRRHPRLAVWLVFGLSGLLHEYALNLPLWLVTGRNLFGTMMIYFLLQALGVQLEHRFLKKHPRINVFFAWLVVFGPVPLVWHESMLRTLHLWPG